MADGTIQVPPDSTGSKVDGASLPVGGNTVIRQRMVIGDNSATAQFATVTGGALLVTHNGGIAISGTVALAAGAANIGTVNNISAAVVLAAGVANIGSINNISATVNTVVGAGTALIGAVSLGAGTANIGFINGISATVNVLIAAGTNLIGAVSNAAGTALMGAVSLAAGTANIGFINNISAPVVLAAGTNNIGFINNISATVSTVVGGFLDPSGTQRNVVDSANLALRVNVVAGSASGPSNIDSTTFSTGVTTIVGAGYIFFSASATTVTDGRIAAGRITDARGQHVNLRNNAGTEVGTAAAPLSVKVENQSATVSVVIAAGAANIGFIDKISATINTATYIGGFRDNSGNVIQIVDSANIALRVAGYGTLGSIPIGGFIDGSGTNRNVVDSVNLALRVTVTTPLTINAISQTVTVVTALPWVVAQPSASHGPLTLQISTSATATLIAAPGAGLHIYVTELVVTNGGTVLTGSQVGPTGSIGQVTMIAGASGGGSRMAFDPPWKLQSNTAAICRVDPNPSGNFYFVVNFFVAA